MIYKRIVTRKGLYLTHIRDRQMFFVCPGASGFSFGSDRIKRRAFYPESI